jgi:predicted glycogen debranching enzyme
MPTLHFGRQICSTLAEGTSREWLVADGLGGYAMGTVSGLRTRRYHGLLVTAREHPGARSLALAALDLVVVVGDRRIALSTHQWASGAIEPNGHRHLSHFSLIDGVPRWRWTIGDIVIEREVAMVHGAPTVAVHHRLIAADRDVSLELTPLCTWRDAHGERLAGTDPPVEATANGFVFERNLRVAGPSWRPAGAWYRGAYLAEEAARGLNAVEDMWAAGSFEQRLAPGESVSIIATADLTSALPVSAEQVIDGARARARAILGSANTGDETDQQLVLAADQFVVTAASGPSVVAGYPWFGEWSRDTMTSYEGLFLETRRWDEGRALLLRAAGTLSRGMLANTADAGGLEYNTSDATLWFVHAIARHVAVTGDIDLADALAEAVGDIVDHHLVGTRFGIGVDASDGLLSQGEDGWALTWMDARVDGRPVTPRRGKAVDINALWINALGSAAALAHAARRPADKFSALDATARTSFHKGFVRDDGYGLLDLAQSDAIIDAAGSRQVRPNQLLALSLPYAAGGPASVVEVCRRELLTDRGLRSLSPADPAYIGQHRGGPAARDRAYHQGTVWPWLIGPYVDAAFRVGERPATVLDTVADQLLEAGIGSISETADGDAPHGGTGCPFQAWSVAEVLRARRRLLRDSGEISRLQV